jgi:hypothetical protein
MGKKQRWEDCPAVQEILRGGFSALSGQKWNKNGTNDFFILTEKTLPSGQGQRSVALPSEQ